MLNSLLGALLSYLINQLPSIQNLKGSKGLIIWLILEVIVLITIVSSWKEIFSKSSSFQVAVQTFGAIVLLFFIFHTFLLGWRIYQASKQDNLTNQNSTKILKTPEYWRRELLKVMKLDVEIRFNDSLHNQEIIRVGREEQPEAVGRQPLTTNNNSNTSDGGWLQPKRWLQVFNGRTSELDSGKPIIEAFDKSDIAGRLLILGEPGAGKTTLLLELARDLLERAEQYPEKPIPVLFELTNWRDDEQAIGEWLIADLKFRYNVAENISHQWLSENKLLPLLDGLDELGLTRQKKCVDKINDLLQKNSNLLPLVVCCRREEYEKSEVILNKLRGAVYLQALSEGQIKEYLRRVGFPKLWENLQNDPDGLGELAKIPLFLSLIPIAYPDGSKNQFRNFNSQKERQEYQISIRKYLFDTYIKRKLEAHHNKKGYKTEDTKKWLIWLAQKMEEHNLKEFYTEKIQPSYLVSRFEKIQYYLTFWLISGLIFGVIIGLNFGVNNGLISGTIIGAIYLIVPKINATETLKIGFNFKAGLLVGLIIGVISNLVYGLICGMIYGLISGMRGGSLNYRKYPNQGIQESAKNTAIFIFIASPITILLFLAMAQIQGQNLNVETILIQGFSFALFCGINFAGNPILQHISLRLILWKNRSIPWNYSHFLTYASDRKLINKVGGRFTFLHALLQEHFAQME